MTQCFPGTRHTGTHSLHHTSSYTHVCTEVLPPVVHADPRVRAWLCFRRAAEGQDGPDGREVLPEVGVHLVRRHSFMGEHQRHDRAPAHHDGAIRLIAHLARVGFAQLLQILFGRCWLCFFRAKILCNWGAACAGHASTSVDSCRMDAPTWRARGEGLCVQTLKTPLQENHMCLSL